MAKQRTITVPIQADTSRLEAVLREMGRTHRSVADVFDEAVERIREMCELTPEDAERLAEQARKAAERDALKDAWPFTDDGDDDGER